MGTGGRGSRHRRQAWKPGSAGCLRRPCPHSSRRRRSRNPCSDCAGQVRQSSDSCGSNTANVRRLLVEAAWHHRSVYRARRRLVSADEAFIDLDLLSEWRAFGVDHRPAQLVQHHPRRLIAAQAELALQLHRGQAGRRCAHQVGRPEPQVQRRARLVQHRASGQRRLPMAGRAFPQHAELAHWPGMPVPAPRAAEALRPARLEQVSRTRLAIREPALKFDDRPGEVRTRHSSRLPDLTG